MYCRLTNGVLVDLSAGKYKNCSGVNVSYIGAKKATVSLTGGSKVFVLPPSIDVNMLNNAKIEVIGDGLPSGTTIASISKSGVVTMTKAASSTMISNVSFYGVSSSICGGWKYFLADCPKGNMLCSGMSGAWVPSVTVCYQGLF